MIKESTMERAHNVWEWIKSNIHNYPRNGIQGNRGPFEGYNLTECMWRASLEFGITYECVRKYLYEVLKITKN